MNKPLLGFALFPTIIVLTLIVGVIGQGCAGDNPPFAPFGSEITILNPIEGIIIPPLTLEPITVEALVTDPDGLPLNDVRVLFSLSFSGTNSLVVDTDGDGLGDARALQLVDPDACGGVRCELVPISQWFGLDAFVDSPLEKLTDDRGVADVIILISGDNRCIDATLTVSTQSGAVDTNDFEVNQDDDCP
ncbi:MAG: hypothetical protein HYW01_09030 [Deltaproteobacteria bacterium]|nr:hypothetical protein [Deltaproteobacteria bacterium]